MNQSLLILSPELQNLYTKLRLYSFFWWGAYSLLIIFQPLFLVQKGFPIWGIFANGALEAIIALCFQNFWSNRADKNHKIKEYMLLGNIFIAIGCIFMIFVNSLWSLFFLTLLLRSGPPSDVFATVLSYKISEQCNPENLTLDDRKFHNINLFARYRKFGSLGWAIVAPIAGLGINYYGFNLNFIFGAIFFVILSIWAYFSLNTTILKTHQIQEVSKIEIGKNLDTKSPQSNQSSKSSSLFFNLRSVLKNKLFSTFMVATFVFAIAANITYSTQGIFYGLFVPNDYFSVALTYSIAAFFEWPTMNYIAKRIRKYSWERIVILSFFLTGVRYAISPLLLILNGNIWWAYTIQIFTGILFGIRLPPSTYGIHTTLAEDRKTLGQSFNITIQRLGAFMGSIIGFVVAYMVPVGNNAFITIYWIAALAAIFSGLWFFMKIIKMNHSLS